MPVALTYDNLPPGSIIRYEVTGDAATILLLPGEASQASRKEAFSRSAWNGTLAAGLAVLLASLLLPQIHVRRVIMLPRALHILLYLATGTFIVALFALFWWIAYREKLHVIERILSRRSVVLSVSPGRILIESTRGEAQQSGEIRQDVDVAIVDYPGETRVRCLRLVGADRVQHFLFAGLSRTELNWIASEIKNRFG